MTTVGAAATDPLQRLWHNVNEWADRARLEFIFVAIALTWGVAQIFIVPPFQVPDEGDHWFRAWALTDGQLTADREGFITLPSILGPSARLYASLISNTRVLPPFLEGQPGFTSYEELLNGAAASGNVRISSRTANYGPVGYVPQAAGIGLGRLVGASPLACFYLARLANLFAAVALLFLAIRLTPFGKALFALLALLPMTMFQLASVSCDALTIAGAMFFTSLLLWLTTRPTLRGADVALVLICAALFLNIKPGYEAFVLLVLLLKPAQLGGRARYLAFGAAVVLVTLGVFLIDFVATGAAERSEAVAATGGQLSFVVHQPLAFLGILWSSLDANLLSWTLEGIGVLGWFSVALPPALYVFVLATGVAFFFARQERVDLQVWQRLVLASTGAAAFVTIALALFLFLPTESGDLSFQGRYLAPIWLVLLLSGYGIRFTKWRLGALPMIVALVVIMVVNLHTLYMFYSA